MMASVHAPDTLPGRPPGEGYGLSVRVVNDPVARSTAVARAASAGAAPTARTSGSIPKKIVAILMTQTPNHEFRADSRTR